MAQTCSQQPVLGLPQFHDVFRRVAQRHQRFPARKILTDRDRVVRCSKMSLCAKRRLCGSLLIPAGSKVGWMQERSFSAQFPQTLPYYSIRAATDRPVSPEPIQVRADKLSRVEA